MVPSAGFTLFNAQPFSVISIFTCARNTYSSPVHSLIEGQVQLLPESRILDSRRQVVPRECYENSMLEF